MSANPSLVRSSSWSIQLDCLPYRNLLQSSGEVCRTKIPTTQQVVLDLQPLNTQTPIFERWTRSLSSSTLSNDSPFNIVTAPLHVEFWDNVKSIIRHVEVSFHEQKRTEWKILVPHWGSSAIITTLSDITLIFLLHWVSILRVLVSSYRRFCDLI